MAAVRMWIRLDIGRRWRSLTVLALLVAIAAGLIMAALAGARRGASVISRVEARTRPATVMALPNQPGFDWAAVRRLPDVESVSTFLVDYAIGVQLPGGQLLRPADDVFFPTADDNLMRTIETPIIYRGRAFDPNRPTR